MSNTKTIRVNANIFFEVPADYDVTGKEYLNMPPVGVGLFDANGNQIVETAKEAEAIEVTEGDYI